MKVIRKRQQLSVGDHFWSTVVSHQTFSGFCGPLKRYKIFLTHYEWNKRNTIFISYKSFLSPAKSVSKRMMKLGIFMPPGIANRQFKLMLWLLNLTKGLLTSALDRHSCQKLKHLLHFYSVIARFFFKSLIHLLILL